MRKQQIDKIEARIDRLHDTAADLLEREQAMAVELEDRRGSEPRGRLRAARHHRALTKAEAELHRLKTEREQLVERELNGIMVALELHGQAHARAARRGARAAGARPGGVEPAARHVRRP